MNADKGNVEYGARDLPSDEFGKVFQPYIAIRGLLQNDHTVVFHSDVLFKSQQAAFDFCFAISNVLSGKFGRFDEGNFPSGAPSDIVK